MLLSGLYWTLDATDMLISITQYSTDVDIRGNTIPRKTENRYLDVYFSWLLPRWIFNGRCQ